MKDDQRTREIIAKVRKLQALAERAGTPAEAAAAMGRVQELLERYAIDETALAADVKSEREERPIAKRVIYRHDVAGPIPTWLLTLGQATVRACRGYFYFMSHGHGYQPLCAMAGHEDDLERAELLLPWLVGECQRLLREALDGKHREEGKRWQANFLNGCASKIGARLSEANERAAEEARREAVMSPAERAYARARAEAEAGDPSALLELDRDPDLGTEATNVEIPAGEAVYALARVETALAKLKARPEEVHIWIRQAEPCNTCDGSGKIQCSRWNSSKGSATFYERKCRKCKGTGRHSNLRLSKSRRSGRGRGFGQGRKAGERATLRGPRAHID